MNGLWRINGNNLEFVTVDIWLVKPWLPESTFLLEVVSRLPLTNSLVGYVLCFLINEVSDCLSSPVNLYHRWRVYQLGDVYFFPLSRHPLVFMSRTLIFIVSWLLCHRNYTLTPESLWIVHLCGEPGLWRIIGNGLEFLTGFTVWRINPWLSESRLFAWGCSGRLRSFPSGTPLTIEYDLSKVWLRRRK